MITLRKADERGHADHGWLRSWHSFSFADYHDPAHMGWGPLRVINEDIVAPGTGFGMHGHRDMEIVTYLLSGPLRHQDSMDNGETFRAPEVQRMSAGRGVMHSEFNASADEPVHLLQIWIEPTVRGIEPEYEQKTFADAAKRGAWCAIASPDGRDGSLTIHQDALLLAQKVGAGGTAKHALAEGRRAYLHVVRGEIALGGLALTTGDAARIADETALEISARAESELLLFDLP
ncbi:MAG: pirin family protein [Sulfurisoma sp.]|nr:pirin family protein [Sulfurisoma sp.]